MSKISEIVAFAIYFELVGVVYSVALFAGFGLNYADYANIDDFLLASFKEPIVFVFACVAIIVASAHKNFQRTLYRNLALLAPLFISIFTAVCAIVLIRGFDMHMPLSNTGMEVQVKLNPKFCIEEDNKISTVRLLGRSGDYFFFFDKFTEGGVTKLNTIVLPERAIVQITREKLE